MREAKLKRKISLGIFLTIGVFSVILFESCNYDASDKVFKSYPENISNVAPEYYYSLFKPEVKSRLKLILSYERTRKDTVPNFIYENKYYIQVYKLSDRYNRSLKNSIKEDRDDSNYENVGYYYENPESRITIFDKMVISDHDKPGNIFISLYGDNPLTSIKSDSLVDYSLNFENLSIKYNIHGPQQMLAKFNNFAGGDSFPLEIAFSIKNNKLYLILMSPRDRIALPAKILYNLIASS